MVLFEKDQEIINIAGIPFGGQPGEYPTVLIGSLFYQGHKIVQDPKNGIFDKTEATRLLNQQDKLSEQTGNPTIVDIMGSTSSALINYINFVADNTDVPILIDGTSSKVRLPAIQHAYEIGLGTRTIYNSVDYMADEEEFSQLKELGVKNTILLAYNPNNIWAEGTLEMVTGTLNNKGLLQKCQDAFIENILVDVGVLDVPSIGLSSRSIQLIKEQLGIPVGCAPSNGIATWKNILKENYSYSAYTACAASSGAISILMGADFLIYGPMIFSEQVFPVIGMQDSIIAYYARQLGIKTKTRSHPLHRIF